MEQKKQIDLKIEKNVKVKVSKNGKWISHILPGQGVVVTFSIKYYRAILKAHPEEGYSDDANTDLEQNKLSLLLVSNEKASKEE
jgi:hypothetical protein